MAICSDPSRMAILMTNDELHFAQMVALMGPPPKQFLERSDRCSKYWDSEGTVVHVTDAALF